MFREKIKVRTCTIRDAGPINNYDFDFRFVRTVYKALSERLFSPKEFGKWKFCDDDDIKKVI